MRFYSLIDMGILIPVLGLIGVSLAIMGSTTFELFPQQLIFFVIGLILCLIFASIDYRIWRNFTWIFYILSLLLVLITFFTPQIRGSSRWIDIGWVRLQPSEIVKPFIIVVFAGLLSKKENMKLSQYLIVFTTLLPILLIIFKQPDLGNVLVYLFIFIMMILANGFSILLLAISFILVGLGFPLIWQILKDYQKARILSFINPHADPVGAGYNALQAVIAIGSGQLYGLGLGKGTQSHLLFLPEYHTDFIFASLGEELGLLGGVVVLLFYIIILARIITIASNSENKFGYLLAIGIWSQIFIQVFINMGMNLGILPITGITLPLLSYGGSSIVSTLICLGICISIARVNKGDTPIVIR